jgi:uncharacterized protein
MRHAVRRALLISIALVCCLEARGLAVDVPYLTGRVVDNAEILTPETRARLTAVLKAHEERTGNQIAVLTVPTIQPENIEDYAVKVFESWKLGQKEKDNGVLVVVVSQDRKMRIEVGYGLEPTLTDGACGQIIRTLMTPSFRNGNYDKGVEDGVAAIIARLDGKGEPATGAEPGSSPRDTDTSSGFSSPSLPWPERILFGAFIFGIIGLFTVLGVVTPGVGWFMYVFLIPFWAMFPIVIIGPRPTVALLLTYVICYPLAKLRLRKMPWYQQAASDLKTKGAATIGGFTFTSSGGSSGFSSGGGGFSGGGGSSGGGGASGSW